MRLRFFRRVTPAALPPVTSATLAARPPLPTRPVATPPVGPRYRVTYNRVGEWGRGSTAAPAPLVVHAADRDQLAAAILRDVRSFLPPRTDCRVIVDLAVMAGQLRVGSLGAGTFGLEILPGGDL